MRFRQALRIAAHRLGLAGRPDAPLTPVAVPVVLGAALMALSVLGAVFYLAGAGLWLSGAGVAIARPLRASRQDRRG